MTCKERLTQYLQEQQVSFQVHDHRAVYTAEQMAAAEHLAGKLVAKAVMAFADNTLVMLVLPATYVVDYAKAASAIGTHEVRLATEDEFASTFPDCERGALPVFGNLYNLPVYVDTSLTADETITFPAGTHTASMNLRYADFERLVRPIHVELARQRAGYTA
jgi:Ala-tRNA(Pro) deacylase